VIIKKGKDGKLMAAAVDQRHIYAKTFIADMSSGRMSGNSLRIIEEQLKHFTPLFTRI
jgi:hypothetical protein